MTLGHEGQGLAELETLEAETALVSCAESISASRAANPPNVAVTCDSIRDIQLERIGICGASFESMVSSFSSDVIPGRVTTPSMSGAEPFGEPKFEKSDLNG